MHRLHRSRYKFSKKSKLNLLGFADSILVLIVFFMTSTTLHYISDSGTDISVSLFEEKSLLTLKLTGPELVLSSEGSIIHRFKRQARTGEFSYSEIQEVLGVHKKNENSITFEPENEMTFEEISKVMDIVKNKFNKIIFGNHL